MVAATSLYYDETHRAVILDKNPKHYFCFFIDIGYKEYVNLNNIFYLLDEAKNVSYLFILIFTIPRIYLLSIKVHEKKTKYDIMLLFQVPYLAHKVDLNYIPLHNTMLLKHLRIYYEELYLQPLLIVSKY